MIPDLDRDFLAECEGGCGRRARYCECPPEHPLRVCKCSHVYADTDLVGRHQAPNCPVHPLKFASPSSAGGVEVTRPDQVPPPGRAGEHATNQQQENRQ